MQRDIKYYDVNIYIIYDSIMLVKNKTCIFNRYKVSSLPLVKYSYILSLDTSRHGRTESL